MGYIYIITSPNGKSYIGQTTRPIEKRLKEHEAGKSKNSRRIYNAIKKHGWENFVIDWYECPDEDLNFDEELMVEVIGTLSPNGYNLREGGGSRGKVSEETRQKNSEATKGVNHPMYGKKHSDESKQKNRKSNLGKKDSDETKQKKREAALGEKNHNFGKTGKNSHWYGKTHSMETKQKQSKNSHTSKIVYQYGLDGNFIDSFGSSREAGRHLDKDGTCIRACARGKRKTAYKFKLSPGRFNFSSLLLCANP
jgi:group I intron endonuclease